MKNHEKVPKFTLHTLPISQKSITSRVWQKNFNFNFLFQLSPESQPKEFSEIFLKSLTFSAWLFYYIVSYIKKSILTLNKMQIEQNAKIPKYKHDKIQQNKILVAKIQM